LTTNENDFILTIQSHIVDPKRMRINYNMYTFAAKIIER